MNIRTVAGTVALVLLSAAAAIAPAGSADAQKIKLGSSLSPPSLDSISPYVAVEKGMFKKYGLDVDAGEFRADALHAKALPSGATDFLINMSATEGFGSLRKKPPLKLWGGANPITPY